MGEMAKSSLMRVMRRSLGLVLVSVVMAAAVVLSQRALAQSSGSPAELLQLFQNLTPEQQDAITKQLGLGGGGGISGLLGGLAGAGGSSLSREGTTNRQR
jgi:hypothetical protein